ncbi:MAG: ATP-binding protein [Kiritimatiellae bacterium]|nr:ATP-binding protein [Kiritimatiellia bacterium]
MFIRFSLENFLSFRERQTLDMMAVRTCKERREENTFPLDGKDAVLRTLALYGANASGKSNLFKAMFSCVDFIRTSSFERAATDDIPVIPFLFDMTSPDMPTTFELEFVVEEVWYKYGFSATSKRIESEWLYTKTKESATLRPKFVRKRDGVEDAIEVHPSFAGADDLIVDKTRENALFLSTCAGLAVREAITILKEMSSWSFIMASQNRMSRTARMIAEGRFCEEIVRFINMTDPSVDGLDVEREEYDSGRVGADGMPMKRTRYRVMMKHKMDGKEIIRLPFDFLGSLGTQKAFDLAGPIFNALSTGSLIFIDELDSRLHPILTREIIKLFNDPKTNPKNAQLVFNTHDTNLLNCKVYSPSRNKKEQLLRRDQVYFAERTGEFASRIYSLVDFHYEDGRQVRNDASFEKEYLAGEYGAIPFIGQFDLCGEDHEQGT